MSRTQKTKLNSLVGLIGQAIAILLSFIGCLPFILRSVHLLIFMQRFLVEHTKGIRDIDHVELPA